MFLINPNNQSSWWGGGWAVESVTWLNTDNTDPANPIVQISVDWVTITGAGTPWSPLTAVTGGSGDVTWPASAVDDRIATFDWPTGKIIQDWGAKISDLATAAQWALADSALQSSDIGVTVQAHSSVLDNTTASFTTTDETKLDNITVTQAVNLDTMESDIAWKADKSGALTQFVGNNTHKVFYSDGSGDIQELALGADGTFLKSNGAAVAPSFATPAGSGDVSKVGTPVDNQVGVWTGDGTIEGTTGLTYDGSALGITGNITVSGTVDGRDVATDGTKLDGIEAWAEVNNISDANANDLTDWGDTTLHIHDSRYYTESETDTLLNAKVTANGAITGATKTKITYDTKGLVTAWADATTADIADSSNRRYLTDAQQTIIAATTASFTTADETKLDNITVTQAVDLDQMEIDIAALANGMVYKGNWDASAGTFPGGGAAQTGWFYTVSVGWTVDSVVFNVDDRLVAITDNASTTTYAWNWSKLDATDAVTSVFGRTGNVVATSGDYTASNITNVPAGNISATDVQAALNELDTDKQATGNYITALTGDVTASWPGSASATIANNAVTTAKIADSNVTLAKIENISTAHFLGRHTGGSGVVQQVSATQARSILNVEDWAQVNAIDTVSDTSEIDLTITAKALSASIVAWSIDESKLDSSVNASLDLADTSTQLAFKTIAVSGQSDVVAETKDDTLTLVAWTNVTITTNASTDTITISASGGGGWSPGGSDTQVQFNDGGAFGGDDTFLWDKTANVLTIGKTGTPGGIVFPAWTEVVDSDGWSWFLLSAWDFNMVAGAWWHNKFYDTDTWATAILDMASLSTDRTFTLPDSDWTIALYSQIQSISFFKT